MEGILAAHEQLEKKGNLNKALEDVDKLVQLIQSTRDAVAGNEALAPLHIAKLKTPVKHAFEKVEDDLKEVNKGLNQYQKTLKEKFKNAALPSVANDPLAGQPNLINRAIAMHLLREGKFDVATTFVGEVQQKPPGVEEAGSLMAGTANTWIQEFAGVEAMDESEGRKQDRGHLQHRFSEMYNILDALRNHHNLTPAIEWARKYTNELENRGSNLEFELSRLKFIELYTTEDIMSDNTFEGPIRALEYARAVFPTFSQRYRRETAPLSGSLAFSTGLEDSPYKALFYNQDSWEDVSASFTREFCGLLGLSERSPLYTAVTAGGIALPVLEKVERIMQQTRGQWTSVNELPVETPLPPSYLFHSIFVCPVSKEQATDANPPMMLPCGHVIAKESLEMHSKGKSRMKCPYCPNESQPREAKRVFI